MSSGGRDQTPKRGHQGDVRPSSKPGWRPRAKSSATVESTPDPDRLAKIEQRLDALVERDAVTVSSPEQYWQDALKALVITEPRPADKQDLKAKMRELARGSGFSMKGLYGTPPEQRKRLSDEAAAIFSRVDEVINRQLKQGAATNPRNLKSIIQSEIGNSTYSNDIVELFIAELRNRISGDEQLKRKYRRRAELPDPTLPADAEVNRPTQQLKLRVEPDIAELIDSAAAASGKSRSEWMTDAAIEKIRREQPDLLNKIRPEDDPKP